MTFCTVMGLAIGLLFGADAGTDEETLQGTWKLTSGKADGKALSDEDLNDGKLVMKGEDYSVTLADKGTVTGTMKLDSKKSPKTIDITDASGANKGKTCLGIYEINGDEFRCAFAPPGKPRPTKFAAPQDSGAWVHVWKRAKG